VISNSKIYHPNFGDAERYLCMNVLDDWDPAYAIDTAIQGLLFVLYEPNIEDPNGGIFQTEEIFEQNLKHALCGESIENEYFFGFENKKKCIEGETIATETSTAGNVESTMLQAPLSEGNPPVTDSDPEATKLQAPTTVGNTNMINKEPSEAQTNVNS